MVKKFLLWTSLTLVALVLVLFAVTRIFEDDIEAAVISTLNGRLKTEVRTGSVDFSLFRHFPRAAVVFEDVRVLEPKEFVTTGTVLNARRISLLFNFWDLLSGNYRLSSLVVDDGTLNLQVNDRGGDNYHVWKNDTSGGDMHLELQKVDINSLRVVYYVAGGTRDLDCFIKSGVFSGNFSGEQFTVAAEADLTDAGYRASGVTYLPRQDLKLRAVLDADRKTGLYTLHDTRLNLTGLDLTVDGTIREQTKATLLDLNLQSPGSDMKAVFAFLPSSFSRRADDFEYNGRVNFRCSVKGSSDNPLVRADFSTSDAGLSPRGTPYHLKKMKFKGSFSSRKSDARPVTWLKIEGLSGMLEGKPITADLEVEDFKRPKVRARATMDATLEVLSRFYHPDTLENLTGHVRMNMAFQGTPGVTSSYVSSGTLQFNNVGFRIKGRPVQYKGFNGALELDGGDIVVSDVHGMAGSSDLNLQGVAEDVIGYLLHENKPLIVQASLQSHSLNLDELLARDASLENNADTSFRLNPAAFINFRLGLRIDSLTFRKFRATGLTGDLVLRDRIIMTQDLAMQTCGGSVLLKGMIDGRPADSLKIDYDARISDLDITRLFYEMGNFGQEVITDKHLKGRVTAEVMFRSMWSKKLEVNSDGIYARSDITIANGELNNFEPMLALSRYLKGADLKNIRFSTLTNTVEIKSRKVWIPQMEIKSSALDLNISGTHSFDNRVDYKMQLYLSQLTGRKVKQLNTEFGTIEEDGLGRSRIFLTMTGPASDPEFKVDRKGVEQKISGEIRKEVKSIRETIRQQFGKAGQDTVATPPEKKKKEELQIEFED